MAQWIVTSKATVVPRRTVRPLTTAELHSTMEKRLRDIFDAVVEKRFGNRFGGRKDDDIPKEAVESWEPYSDSEEDAWEAIDIEDTVDSNGRMLNRNPAYDKLLNNEIQMQLEQGKTRGTVRRRAVGPDMEQRGRYDENPYLNSVVYEVEFDDGTIREYAANVIAENMLCEVDDEGYSTTMLRAIIDYERDDAVAVPKSERYIYTRSG